MLLKIYWCWSFVLLSIATKKSKVYIDILGSNLSNDCIEPSATLSLITPGSFFNDVYDHLVPVCLYSRMYQYNYTSLSTYSMSLNEHCQVSTTCYCYFDNHFPLAFIAFSAFTISVSSTNTKLAITNSNCERQNRVSKPYPYYQQNVTYYNPDCGPSLVVLTTSLKCWYRWAFFTEGSNTVFISCVADYKLFAIATSTSELNPIR